jgi:hypothetical protein
MAASMHPCIHRPGSKPAAPLLPFSHAASARQQRPPPAPAASALFRRRATHRMRDSGRPEALV